MKTQGLGIVLASAVLAGGSIGLATLSLAALRGQPVPMGPATLRMSTGEDRRAKLGLDAGVSARDLDRGEADARAALALAPHNNTARLRLAWIDRQRHGRLSPAGVKLVTQSYDLAPYDIAVAQWRVPFALENWTALSPSTRANVRVEALAFGGVRSRMANISGSLRTINNPNGRVSAALWQHRLKTQRKAGQSASGNAPP